MNKDIIDRLNELGGSGEPFLFVVDYKGDKAYIKKLAEIDPCECLYDFGSHRLFFFYFLPTINSERPYLQ